MNDLISCIKAHEGLVLHCYLDTEGYTTIGYGRCIDERVHCGISEEEAEYLLNNDIAHCKEQLSAFTWFKNLDEVRQGVLIELCFNVGLMSLLQFKTMIGFIQKRQFKKASDDLLETEWSKEVGTMRSHNMAYRLCTGTYDT